MYPNLTPWLVVALGAAAAVALFIAIRRPFLRKLALRQIGRRRREAALVVAGSVLGTAIIVGSLIVGDTLNFSVKRYAYLNLGPVDEMVVSPHLGQGAAAERALAPLRRDPRVDGMLTVRGDQAAVTVGSGRALRAEPRAVVWEMDVRAAARFGGTVDGGSGLTGPPPADGGVVVNQDLATALGARVGDRLTVYLFGWPWMFEVDRIVPTEGIAGLTTGGSSRDLFVAPGTLAAASQAASSGREPTTVTLISNAGGVEAGSDLSDAVAARAQRLLGPLARSGTSVEKVKQDLLEAAKAAGDSLGSLFLFIGSFSIIAGILLLVNIFVMLAEERKPELGMLRAIGMKRSRLVRSFMIEGTVYALVAAALGIVVGFGVGHAVVLVAGRIFRSSSADASFDMTFRFSTTSLINGFAIGFLISFVTVALTSLRISRINIVAAIRDLNLEGSRPPRRRWLVASSLAAALLAAESAVAISRSQGVGAYLFPALTILALCPLAARLLPKRWVYTAACVATIGWTLAASTVRPHVLDSGSTAVYVVIGVLLTFATVFVVSENQRLVTRPFARLIERPTAGGLSGRLAVAYPTARRFRTGAILIMYGLVVFTLVIIIVLGRMIDATVTSQVADASGGFPIRVDWNPSSPIENPPATFGAGRFSGRVQTVVPLLVAPTRATMTGVFSDATAVVVGAGPAIFYSGFYPLSDRSPLAATDRAAWALVQHDPSYVIVDQFLGLTGGGPPAIRYRPGDHLTLLDPGTGQLQTKTIAGILKASDGLRGIQNSGTTSPIVMSWDAARAEFGDLARPASALVKPTQGTSVGRLAEDLQAAFLTQGLSATQARVAVEQSMAATRGFFQLMQGFLALGLLIGVAGLGIVMVRAVRERRRTIGVLRALGFASRTVERAFLGESSFVALEGILVGTVLGVMTSYLLFTHYDAFRQSGIGFPIPWVPLGVVVLATGLASVLATAWPARQASRVRPAVALRIAD